jgi:hypothetical protein
MKEAYLSKNGQFLEISSEPFAFDCNSNGETP